MSLNQGRGFTSNIFVSENGVIVLDPLAQNASGAFKAKTQGYYLVELTAEFQRIDRLVVTDGGSLSLLFNGATIQTKNTLVSYAATNTGSIIFYMQTSISKILLFNGTTDNCALSISAGTLGTVISQYTFNVARVG